MSVVYIWIFIFFLKKSAGSLVCTERLLPGLSDGQFTASSQKTGGYLPSYARLNSSDGHNWCPSGDDMSNNYIQASLKTVEAVGGVITQGRHDKDAWVTSYHVQYSLDGTTWLYVQDHGGLNKKFLGNSDRETWVTQTFDAIIRLQYLRIYPLASNYYPCLRFDVLGCQETTIATTTLTPFQLTSENAQSQYTSEADEGHSSSTTVQNSEQSSEPSTSISVDSSYTSTPETSPITAKTNNVQCIIVCPKNYTKKELTDMINKLKQELRAEKTKTSNYIRTKTSASDERRSSAAIGYFGIVILCVFATFIVLLDLPNLLQLIEHIRNH